MNKGMSLIELIFIILVATVFLSVIVASGINFINRARFQATVREMQSIAQASVQYYDSSSSDQSSLIWPSTVADLVPKFLPQLLATSPLGAPYQLTPANNMITVSTVIPKGILTDPLEGSFLNIAHGTNQDQISITRSVPNEFTYQVKD